MTAIFVWVAFVAVVTPLYGLFNDSRVEFINFNDYDNVSYYPWDLSNISMRNETIDWSYENATVNATANDTTATNETSSAACVKVQNYTIKPMRALNRYCNQPLESKDMEVMRFCDCDKVQCIRKCCKPNEIFVETHPKERPVCTERYPEYNYIDPDVFDGLRPTKRRKELMYVYAEDPCQKYELNDYDELFFLQKNGSMILAYNQTVNISEPWEININSYCFEKRVLLDGSSRIAAFVCFNAESSSGDAWQWLFANLRLIGLMVSVPFMLVTCLVYLFIPELRNLHGKTLICHVSSLMTAYVFLATIQINTEPSNSYCVTAAIIVQFAFLMSFFWLNVMCFDIWWTFSGCRGFHGSLRDTENKKFLIYSVYAWSGPTVLCAITMFMQFYPLPDSWILPRIGQERCWFGSFFTIFMYFYGPMLILIMCNIVLFVITARRIIQIKRDTAMLKQSENKRHNFESDTQRFNLYLKLFILMGINWSAEVMSGLTTGTHLVWLVPDIANTLQGLMIFVIFVCKRHIWRLLVKRYYTLMGRPNRARSSLTRTTGISLSQSTMSIGARKLSVVPGTPGKLFSIKF